MDENTVINMINECLIIKGIYSQYARACIEKTIRQRANPEHFVVNAIDSIHTELEEYFKSQLHILNNELKLKALKVINSIFGYERIQALYEYLNEERKLKFKLQEEEFEMDIYSYAKSLNYGADYYDPHTGYTYAIQEYGRAIKELNADKEDHHLTDGERKQYQESIDKGIAVYYEAALIGYARKDMK